MRALWFTALFSSICLEGLGRKYLPAVPSIAFYFLKDLVLLIGLLRYRMPGHSKRVALGLFRGFQVVWLAGFVWTVIQLANPEQTSVPLGLLGLRSYWLWWLAPPIIANALRQAEDKRKAIYVLLVMAIGISALAAYQFASPADSAANLYSVVDGEEVYASAAATVASTGRARVASTFSFVSGFTAFTILIPTLLLSIGLELKDRKLRRWALIATLATGAVVPMAGSRGAVVLGIGALLLCIWSAGLFFTRVGRRIVIGALVSGLLALFAFPEAFAGVASRFEQTEETGTRLKEVATVLPPVAMAVLDYPLAGIGTGMQQNARASLKVYTSWVAESEVGRYLVELGPVGYLLVWTTKLGLALALFRAYRILKRAGKRGSAGAALAYSAVTMISSLTFDHVFQSLFFVGCGIILSEVIAVQQAERDERARLAAGPPPIVVPKLMPAEHPSVRRDVLLFAFGAAIWLAVQVATWPAALSFSDEIGYMGQSRVLLTGHVRPSPGDPGVWLEGTHGRIGKYPLFLPVIVAPLFALTPRLVFAVGIVSALALACIAARMLRLWGRSPVWALLLLAHPTVVIISRTVMVDVMLSAFAVGAWYALARDRRVTACVLNALVVAAKPTGVLIACALIFGEAVRLYPTLPRRRLLAWLTTMGSGIGAGAALTAVLNFVATGTPWYGYGRDDVGAPLFSLAHIPNSLPWHAAGLLLCPPLLVVGAWSLWRRRAFGPLFAAIGLVAAMSCYVFVDRGQGFAETLALAPRLILPAMAILMIGYADLIAGLVARRPALGRWASLAATILPAIVCWVLASRHRAWQEAPAVALASARQATAALDQRQLGLMGGSVKVGMLFPGRVVAVDRTAARSAAVVLCGEQSPSHRQPGLVFRCDLPSHDDRPLPGGFHVFVRSKQP